MKVLSIEYACLGGFTLIYNRISFKFFIIPLNTISIDGKYDTTQGVSKNSSTMYQCNYIKIKSFTRIRKKKLS